MTQLTIQPAAQTWVVRAGGALIAESSKALEVREGSLPFVIYFPRADVAMAFLDANAHRTTCPHKGEASYFDLITKSKALRNAAWSYESPLPDCEALAGYIAFYATDAVTVEQL